jgi:hypothetical protein
MYRKHFRKDKGREAFNLKSYIAGILEGFTYVVVIDYLVHFQ